MYPARNGLADVPHHLAYIGWQTQRDLDVDGWGHAVHSLIVELADINNDKSRARQHRKLSNISLSEKCIIVFEQDLQKPISGRKYTKPRKYPGCSVLHTRSSATARNDHT